MERLQLMHHASKGNALWDNLEGFTAAIIPKLLKEPGNIHRNP